MAFEGLTAAFFGLGAAMPKKKKESVIEPFKRTLDLANAEHDKAVERLICAATELAHAAVEKQDEEKKEHKDES